MRSIYLLGHELNGPGFESWQEQNSLLISSASTPVLGPIHPPLQWMAKTLPGWKKAARCTPDRTPYSKVEVQNKWIYTFTPPHAFKVWCLIKHNENSAPILPSQLRFLTFHRLSFLFQYKYVPCTACHQIKNRQITALFTSGSCLPFMCCRI